jgi:hypothetical protein
LANPPDVSEDLALHNAAIVTTADAVRAFHSACQTGDWTMAEHWRC